jgi:hypothetical protein
MIINSTILLKLILIVLLRAEKLVPYSTLLHHSAYIGLWVSCFFGFGLHGFGGNGVNIDWVQYRLLLFGAFFLLSSLLTRERRVR